MSSHPKIKRHHQERLAYVYIRQSTLRQVAENQESQDLQYQLATHAGRLGWSAERTVIIDDDLGKSGASRHERSGFEQLFTDIGTGKVGILLVTDVSRLARNCADWYQLLDVAAHNHVLVSDSGGVYDPRAFDDRLLLGVKGAFSEAQWHIMRQQMQAARLNKAKRGELFARLPVGLERLPNGEVIKTADQQVQSVILLIFATFRRLGSLRAVLAHFIAAGIDIPRRVRTLTEAWGIEWVKPTYSRLYQVIKLPAYAGAYAYGKREKREGYGGQKTRYGRRLPPDEWQVLLHDHFPAYISWEVFMENQAQLADNWQGTPFVNPDDPVNRGVQNHPFAHPGAAGKGVALLQGIVYCGHCGRKMAVRYRDKPAYVCAAAHQQTLAPRCQFVPYAHADRVVVTAFLEALEGSEIALTLTALEDIESQQGQLEQQWHHQLERAEYAVALAKARYVEVDPKMRLVAAELERAWEEALVTLEAVKREWETVQATQMTPLTAANRALIEQLASDLPALWAAPSTSSVDRKRLLRTLIGRVDLHSRTEPGMTQVTITWLTGAVSTALVSRPKPGHPSDPILLAEVERLASLAYTDQQMADELNQRGVVSSWHVKDDPTYRIGQPVSYWTAKRVGNFRRRHKIQIDFAGAGFLSAADTAAALGVSVSQLLSWVRRGLVPGRQQRPGAAVWIPLDEQLRERLQGIARQEAVFDKTGNLPLVLYATAADYFRLSAEELTAALKAGRFVTWRLAHGAQYRWYIQETGSAAAEPADRVSL